jgi:hypothetical protein
MSEKERHRIKNEEETKRGGIYTAGNRRAGQKMKKHKLNKYEQIDYFVEVTCT